MKTQSIVILSVCVAFCFLCLVACGLVSSYLTSQLIAQKNAKVLLLVAKDNYPEGAAIKDPEEMFEFQEILARDAPVGFFSDLEDLRGLTLISGIRKGQPVLQGFVQKTKDTTKSVSIDHLAPGRRAIAIKTKGQWGFIEAGSRYDVIHIKSEDDPKEEAKMLFERILVRAVEREKPNKEGDMQLVPLIVTLDVTPEQALVLAALKEKGSIVLVLDDIGHEKSDNRPIKKP